MYEAEKVKPVRIEQAALPTEAGAGDRGGVRWGDGGGEGGGVTDV